MWLRLQEQQKAPISPQPLDGAVRRRPRSARFKTQPVTFEEVADARAFNDKKQKEAEICSTKYNQQPNGLVSSASGNKVNFNNKCHVFGGSVNDEQSLGINIVYIYI